MGNMFCMDSVASQQHPPCFTQCMDLLTPLCYSECLSGERDEWAAPCSLKYPHVNPICVIRKSTEYKLDIRFEPWSACMRDPFRTPLANTNNPRCAGRIPVNHVSLCIVFTCTNVFTGVCGNPLAIYEPLSDPFYSISMSLSDFLGINPIGIRKPTNGIAWSVQKNPPIYNGDKPDKILTIHMDIYTDEGRNGKLNDLLEIKSAKILETHFRSQMILPYGIDVQELYIANVSTKRRINWVLVACIYTFIVSLLILAQDNTHMHDA